ncbi:MAG: hypothetical protein ABL918_01185 [Chakrabartia sp.]
MTLVQILPIVAAVGLALTTTVIAARPFSAPSKNIWLFPAFLSFLFLIWSLYAALTEGVTGFWPEHTRNLWGNQIWFDLLFAAGIGWTLIVPRAKAQAMSLFPWLTLILLTGCIGFLAMLSRLFYLEEKSTAVA